MTMPADELRAAATKLRTAAATAAEVSPSPWLVTDELVIRCSNKERGIVADRSCEPDEAGDLPYIAAMHPGVGAALADWLEGCADLHEPRACEKHEGRDCAGCQWCADEDWPCADIRNALAVARQINGGAK